MRFRLVPLLVLLMLLALTGKAVADENCPNQAYAQVVSLQGELFYDPKANGQWQTESVHLNRKLCEGSRLRLGPYSRATIRLPHGVFRLGEGTVLTLNVIVEGKATLLDLLKGFLHFISRTPQHLQISTPIANAGPEGTEFALSVNDDKAALWVYEGGVRFFNAKGSVHLDPGQSAQTFKGQAPQAKIDIKPEDAVNWALYYPPLLPYPGAAEKVDPELRAAIQDYRQGRVDAALQRLDAFPPERQTPYFHKVRGAIRLSVGQSDLAMDDIRALLANNANHAEALALESVLALTQNRKDEAYDLANRAVAANPNSAPAFSALSYAEQGSFQLDKAQAAANKAAVLAPHDAMTLARKAELELSQGLASESKATARQALALDPDLERTQTVTGFAHLLQMDTDAALQAFNKAVELDSTAPLPRLGLGLAKIRNGDLEEGRQDLEIAAVLDPNNSIVRSYLGKAYYEERRSQLADDQFKLAKIRDAKDPTPYFYDALKKQTENRPIEALRDLEKAMELNDNRAVFRSKQLLDSDRAARGASLARIYNDLGFEQRGVVEAISSLQTDPTNYSAHRFLSDSYVNQSGKDTAQLSELLQAKMLQPININPVQPHLSVSQRGLLTASGIANSSFQDFTRVFEGNRPQLLVSGVAGNQGILSDEAVLSGIYNRFSYSLGQFHSETDGFSRPYGTNEDKKNTEQKDNVYDAFLQWQIHDRLNTQFEYIYRETYQGDLHQYLTDDCCFNESNYLRQNSYRGGINLKLFSDDHLLFSYIHTNSLRRNYPVFNEKTRYTDYINQTNFFEGQYLKHYDLLNLIAGINVFNLNKYQKSFDAPDSKLDIDDDNGANGHSAYAYVNLKMPEKITGTLGIAYDFSESFPFSLNGIDRNKTQKAGIYPKVGLQWDFADKSKLRLAYIRGQKKPIDLLQTLEPTHIAGFNQFYDNIANTIFSFYGAAIDLEIKPGLFSGIEISRRELFGQGQDNLISRNDLAKFYLNWAFLDHYAFNTGYRFIHSDHPGSDILNTHIFPIEFRYFDPSGLFGRIGGTYISQTKNSQTFQDSTNFFLVDAGIGYRLPQRRGIISFEVKNLFDNKFRYEDLNRYDETNIFINPSVYIPQRTFFGRITLNF